MPLASDKSSLHVLGQAPERVRLSKSRFLAGVQCLKRLYLKTYPPETETSAEPRLEEQLEQNEQVGKLAREAFSGGAPVHTAFGAGAALAQTAALIDNASVPAIFDAAFRFDGITIRVDILQRQPGNQWKLIEVKSSTSNKDHYLYDLALQHYVISACGLSVSAACLMHLDNSYLYGGVRHDAAKLFTTVDLSAEVRHLQTEIPRVLLAHREALRHAAAPDIAPGAHCLVPYQCEFFSACNPPLPEHHVSTLPRLSAKKVAMLAGAGISVISEIPPDFPLSESQQRACACLQSGQAWFSESLAGELSTLQYPLCFMDFETIFPAIPRYAGTHPYSQIPFQWSVHRRQTPTAEVQHFDFLAEDERDPRRNFFNSLSEALGTCGHIIAYNAGFETQRLEELACCFPEYRARVNQLKDRLWDLLPLVKRNVYHPNFGGSFSLKSVLPALLPALTYQEMEVANGTDAGLAWEQMLKPETAADAKIRIKRALLAYCKQDTFALVALLTFMGENKT